jgi:hypothetical protein
VPYDLGIQPRLLCHPFSGVHVASRTLHLLQRLLDFGTGRDEVSIVFGLYLKKQLCKTRDVYGENQYHDLHLDTLTANIVEHEFGTRGSLIINPPSSLNLYILAGFSRLEGTVRSNKVFEIGVDVEFMRVRGGVLRLAKLVDVP